MESGMVVETVQWQRMVQFRIVMWESGDRCLLCKWSTDQNWRTAWHTTLRSMLGSEFREVQRPPHPNPNPLKLCWMRDACEIIAPTGETDVTIAVAKRLGYKDWFFSCSSQMLDAVRALAESIDEHYGNSNPESPYDEGFPSSFVEEAAERLNQTKTKPGSGA